uniref:dynein axonemal heavy chain 6-like isoform X2 n=1 Tax=Semicossyphus pulcher TaxID=241346 RepID=UPI0037E80358
MALTSPRASLLSCPGQSGETESREWLHKLPELQRASIPPRLPVHVQDQQALVKRRVKRKQPSLHHLKAREQMFFPGWYTQSPPSGQTEQPQRRREQLPVHLPPLPPKIKSSQKVVSTPSIPRRPSSVKRSGQLDNPSKIQFYQYSNNDRLMISNGGVLSVCEDEFDFVTFERWEEEYNYDCKLMSIPFFALFKKWKPFYLWRTQARNRKVNLARKSVQKNLFIVSQSLGPALRDIRKMCCQISDMDLYHWDKKHTYSLHEFQDIQFKQLQEVSTDLKKFQGLVKEVTICACRNYLSDPLSKSDHTNDQKKEKIIMQINNTLYSSRLICFIRLVDYLVVNTLHILVVNAVTKLLSVVHEHVRKTPSHDIIKSWGQHSEAKTETAEEGMDGKCSESETPGVQPMFITELMLDTKALTYKPSEEDFQETVAEIVGWFQKTVMSVNTLTADVDLYSLTQPTLYKESLQFAFDAAKVYSHTLEHFLLFYKENDSLDLDKMQQQDHGLSFFEKALKINHCEHKEALAIQQKTHLGLLLVDKTQLKEKFVSSPLCCLEVINEMLTKLAKKKLDAVIAEVCKAQFKLEFRSSTTAEFANFLTFLSEIQDRITVLEMEQETVSQMYNLIYMYSVPMPPENLVVFATLQPSINSLHNIIDEAMAQRDSSMDKFCSSLHKDIKQMNHEVRKTKLKSQDPQILDINADPSQIRLLLGEIQSSIDELQDQATTYTSYQKIFKVQVTKFDTLEELISEFRLKQLLWESLEEWDSLQDGWRQCTLKKLDLECYSSQVNKYSKYVNKLEKGLPCNNVVASLKDKVEVTKHRLPVITDLLNPFMKPEHWKTLESVVGSSLNVEELTVAVMEDINAFSYGIEIQEMSAQASGEASVEIIVTKLEDLWKTTEFTVLSHGDSKDVFILGGTDDIQVLLDDSIINVGTVASSRYIAPIKLKVEKLLRQLSLFKQTLDEWLLCQRNWLYLESIFLAPEMKRQLPAEYKMFLNVDKSWKEIMAKVNKMPNAFKAATQPDLLETFQHNNTLLDEMQKCLEVYFESKRVVFPRFYFLSNDELLKNLAQTRNPQAVQPHLTKCFDAITQLEFALLPEHSSGATGTAMDAREQETVYSKDIINMISPEGENVRIE